MAALEAGGREAEELSPAEQRRRCKVAMRRREAAQRGVATRKAQAVEPDRKRVAQAQLDKKSTTEQSQSRQARARRRGEE